MLFFSLGIFFFTLPVLVWAAPITAGSPVCPCINPVTSGKITATAGTLSYPDGGTTYIFRDTYGSSCDQWQLGSVHFGATVDPNCPVGGTGSVSCPDTWCYVDPCNCELAVT